jgi:hypothetical protein
VKDGLVRAVALAICEAKGHDPQQLVVPGQPYLIDGKSFAAVTDFAEPQQLWVYYKAEAEAAIKAVSAYLVA